MVMYDNRSMVRVTHVPTGRAVEVRDRSIKRAKEVATGWLRSLVAANAETPEAVIRTYDLQGPAGTFIKDATTGRRLVEGPEVADVLDGNLDLLRR